MSLEDGPLDTITIAIAPGEKLHTLSSDLGDLGDLLPSATQTDTELTATVQL